MDPQAQLEQVLNFRDVGKTVNKFLGQRRIREGVFYRSARLDHATSSDRHALKDEFGVKTIIDLRSKTEHREQAAKHHTQSVHLPSDQRPSLRIEGLRYENVRITGPAFEKHLARQLSWWNLLKMLFLYILGYRLQAVSVVSRQVMLPRGLVGMGLDTLDHSVFEIRQALLLYASVESLPSVIHCTQGKDRTGLVCALLLMILDTPLPAIEHDYLLTDAALVSDRHHRIMEIRQIGLTEDWADTASEMITKVSQHISDQYGGLDNYLDHIGVGPEDRVRIRKNLLY
ncbi:hypothetical protein S40288_01166 [Stachybotrys chartarum IBT 40288]|nr:hypothetical protein S40288_01166 [Stachybotrys chartarum IBT 40288]